jgi:hypothetical protein
VTEQGFGNLQSGTIRPIRLPNFQKFQKSELQSPEQAALFLPT